ncbi:major facilitator superfamily MFS_1 [Beutenbergia cavernae DSM 12333]|uniref:Major facilitator superfamily MFS_1 n=1 Tax=Beutenbergia cavernae (strain ATCC BAA-8 / DSM 12333 / CCUG 43141 / JCM 11478 / NBRC 16432 / NCIMB 13614 / HKI 0122) TaxID=471853 RepID=C5BYP2_BEUC1|nr:MFS transporter [Beutenbergia cavernae]ACQ79000.1 major facilitator superfamily MFS_1 [Beutenbergia cavernae DSM 12333]
MTRTTEPLGDAVAPPPAETAPRPEIPHRVVLAGMVALISLAAFEALGTTTAMPAVAAALDGLGMYAVAFATSLATSIVGMTLAGGWADRRGPNPPLIAGVTTFVAGLVVAGSAHQMVVVVAGRALQGIGTGLFIVALYVLVARVFAPEQRPKVFAAFAAAWVVPSIVGPALAGLVVDHIGWRWVFLGAAVLVVPTLALLAPGLRAASRGSQDAADDAAAPGDALAATRRVWWAVGVAAGLAVTNLAGARIAGDGPAGHGDAELPAAGGLDVAPLDVVLAVVGLVVVLVCAVPLVPRGTLRAAPGLPSVMVTRASASGAFSGTEAFLPLLLITQRGLTPALAGIILTVGGVSWSTAAWLRGRDRLSSRDCLRYGGLSIAVGIGVAGLLLVPAIPVAVGMVGWALVGFGMGLAHPTTSLRTLELSPVADQGRNSAAVQVSDALGGALLLTTVGTATTALLGVIGSGAFVLAMAASGLLGVAVAVLATRAGGVPSPAARTLDASASH